MCLHLCVYLCSVERKILLQVVKRNMTEFVMREQQMLANLQSAFIVNLLYSFQDSHYLYMCMDMMIGGDLRYQLVSLSISTPI